MKILFISPLPPPAGGIASWTKRVLQSPYLKEHSIRVVSTAVIKSRVGNLGEKKFFDEVKRTRGILRNLKSELNSFKPDIVHLNSPCSKFGLIRDLLCARIVKSKGIKLVSHFRCDINFMVNSKSSLYLLKKLVTLSDVSITLNKISQKFLEEEFKEQSTIIPNFISTMPFNKESVNSEVQKVLYVGHITKLKGSDKIIAIADFYPDIEFILIGYLGNDIVNISLPKNVTIKKEVSKEEVFKEMQEVDIFLFPSLTEGFPNAVLEAMAAGLPIIATDVGAIPDMLEGEGGILVQRKDLEEINLALTKMKQDKHLRQSISEWNIKKVTNFYTEEKVLKLILNEYKKALS